MQEEISWKSKQRIPKRKRRRLNLNQDTETPSIDTVSNMSNNDIYEHKDDGTRPLRPNNYNKKISGTKRQFVEYMNDNEIYTYNHKNDRRSNGNISIMQKDNNSNGYFMNLPLSGRTTTKLFVNKSKGRLNISFKAVSYTHLTLPTICSV